MNRPKAELLAIPFILALLLPASARAEDLDDAQVWVNAAASGKLSESLTAGFDASARFYDNASHLAHVHVRGVLGWTVAKDVQIGAGYAYARGMPRTGDDVQENRIFQQLNFPIATIGKVQFSGRTRLEERFLSNVDGMRLRLRQQVKMTVPLKGPEGLSALVHSEVMLLLNQQGSMAAGLNQMRTFAGLSIPLRGKTALEAGYMNQAIFAGEDRFNHILSLGVTTRF